MKTNVEQSTRGRTLALTGAFLQVAFILASFGAVLGTRHIFKTSHGGDTDVQHLANSIGKVLVFSAVGAAIGLVGLVLLCVALVGSRYRAY